MQRDDRYLAAGLAPRGRSSAAKCFQFPGNRLAGFGKIGYRLKDRTEHLQKFFRENPGSALLFGATACRRRIGPSGGRRFFSSGSMSQPEPRVELLRVHLGAQSGLRSSLEDVFMEAPIECPALRPRAL